MSKTFVRGLALLETIDLYGPLTVGELAQRTGIDKSTVSRTLSACEPDGWIVREQGRISLGPRAALLAHTSSTASIARQAEPLVEAIAGVSGCLTQLYGLVGRNAMVIAAAGSSEIYIPPGLGTAVPLFATAAGKVIAAQLEPGELDRRLPPDPFPDPTREMTQRPAFAQLASALPASTGRPMLAATSMAHDRLELAEQLAPIRAEGAAADWGELHPDLACIAIAWPRTALVAALACLAPPAELAAAEPLVRAVLAAATVPGTTRADVVAAAARVNVRGERPVAAG